LWRKNPENDAPPLSTATIELTFPLAVITETYGLTWRAEIDCACLRGFRRLC
jgi:hypothetical protein